MTSKHTPGNWRYYTEPQPNGCPIVGNGNGLMVAMLAHSINYENQREEALANAHLIAAAPELLAALERVARLNPDAGEIGAGMLHTIVSEARAAIAKATGGVA